VGQALTLAQAERLALKILKEVMEETLTPTNVQLVAVTAATGYRPRTAAEIEAAIAAM
jgi:20S proteasome subunit alpha 5